MKKIVIIFVAVFMTVMLFGCVGEGESDSSSISESISSSESSVVSSSSSESSLTEEEEQALKDEMLGLIDDLKEGD